MRKPASWTVDTFRLFFEGKPQLRGVEGNMYRDEHDLLSLYMPVEQDRLTKYVRGWLACSISWFQIKHITLTNDRERHISSERVRQVVTVMNAIVAFFFFVFPMWGLGDIETEIGKKRVVAILVAFFSLWVGVCVGGSRGAIYAATGTYAAVLLVVVRNDWGPVTT